MTDERVRAARERVIEAWEKRPVSPEKFTALLVEAVEAVEKAGIPYVLIGGVASAAHGRPRFTQDVDLFVKAPDAERVLEALEQAGFEVEKTNPHWIFKAVKDGVLIDVIFRLVGDVYLDDQMCERASRITLGGREVWVMSAEDLLVVKAAANSEECPHHWHDGLALIASTELDWDYVLRRARASARRVLSLLVYADASDLVVPAKILRSLFDMVYEQDAGTNGNGTQPAKNEEIGERATG